MAQERQLMTVKSAEATAKQKKRSISKFLNKHIPTIACMLTLCIMATGIASAEGEDATSADALWGIMTNLIQTWVTRLGGVVMFVGGVMFGLGWKNDDADQKSRGISTIIAGAIVVAVAGLTSQFFA